MTPSSSFRRGAAALALAACAEPFAAADSPVAGVDDGGVMDAGTTAELEASAGPRLFAPAKWATVATQHGDAARTGANAEEKCLRASNVARIVEERRFAIGGQIYAQPLFAASLGALVVASTANEVAAFDATSGATFWKVGPDILGTPGNVVRNVQGPLGILSTPVLDEASDRLFVVARSCPSATATSGCGHRLFELRLSTGALVDSVAIAAAGFQPDWQWNRPGLLLQRGVVYVGWGVGQSGQQHEEDIPYHGFVLAYRADDLHAAPLVHSTTPSGRGGGIWQAGAGLAGDGDAVYATTGNSVLDTGATFAAAPVDEENSIVKWSFDPMASTRYWDPRPYKSDGNVFQYMERWDIDMSSGGVALLPEGNDLVAGSKGGILYLLDRETLAPRQPPLSPFRVPPKPADQPLYIYSYGGGPQILGAPAVWGREVYYWPRFDELTHLRHDPDAHTLVVERQGTEIASGAGGMLSITEGLVWAILATGGYSGGGPAKVSAFDATTLEEKWSAPIAGYPKFVCPTISGGRVFVPSWRSDGSSEVIAFAGPSCD